MTNYAEEQAMELEALQSIYGDDFEDVSADPRTFKIHVATEETPDDEPLRLAVSITYTAQYPDEAPVVQIESDDLEPDNIQAVSALLAEQAAANLGTVMVYTLVSAAKEWADGICASVRQEREAVAREQVEREKQAEQRKFHGTQVTVETFKAWKVAFDREMAEVALKAGSKVDTKKGKLTGRQLFEKDASYMESDIAAYDEGDVVVDESLFENMEELVVENEEEGTNIQYSDED
eukprot:Opistho-1_new@11948